jgi:hypothetical protein
MAMRKLVLVAALAASAVVGTPVTALADGRHGGWHRGHHWDDDDRRYRYRYYNERPVYYYRESYEAPRRYYARPRYSCRTSGTTGLIVGGAAGALLGRELDGGRDRATGTILGAAGGALVGREIDRKHRC